jgi:hypothetical protein
MADTKLSALTELDATPATGDELYIRDVSEATADESKRITVENLVAAASSGPSQANQAALEAETNEDTYAAPDMIKYSPGVAKVWFDHTNPTTIDVSYNGAGVVRDSDGHFTFSVATDMSSANYVIFVSQRDVANMTLEIQAQVAGSYQIRCEVGDVDTNTNLQTGAFGTQV